MNELYEQMEQVSTRYAPVARAKAEELAKDYQMIRQIHYIQDVLDALPSIGAILNKERQIIYSNKTLLSFLEIPSFEAIMGKRPGEMMECLHAGREPGGCGTSEYCKTCGVVNSILQSQSTSEPSLGECRITSQYAGKTQYFDFMVSVKPITISAQVYYVLTLTDISSDKRKKALERIFFHDVLNMAGSLNGLFSLLKDVNDPAEYKELIEMAQEVSGHLTDEVLAQRQLLAAENKELKARFELANSLQCIQDAVAAIRMHPVSQNRNIRNDPESESCTFSTDKALLRRVLVNLLKNALEAGTEGTVETSCFVRDSILIIRVYNEEVMPEQVKLQIFQRSFSSKGLNRGLGTYSIKLLTEEYLGGTVEFNSENGKGTTFQIHLPLHQELSAEN